MIAFTENLDQDLRAALRTQLRDLWTHISTALDDNYPPPWAGDIRLCPAGYQLKAGQPAKSSNCAERRKLFIAGLLPNSETSEPRLLSRLKLVAVLREGLNAVGKPFLRVEYACRKKDVKNNQHERTT